MWMGSVFNIRRRLSLLDRRGGNLGLGAGFLNDTYLNNDTGKRARQTILVLGCPPPVATRSAYNSI